MSEINELLNFEKELEEVIQESKPSTTASIDSKTTQHTITPKPSGPASASDHGGVAPKTPHSSLQIVRPVTAAVLGPAVHPSRAALLSTPKPLDELKLAIRPITTPSAPQVSKPASGIILEDDESIGIVRKRGFDEGPGSSTLQAIKAAKMPASNPVGYVPPFSAVKPTGMGAVPIPPPPPPPMHQQTMQMHPGQYLPPNYHVPPQAQVHQQPIGPAMRTEAVDLQIEAAAAQGEPKKKKHLRYAAGKVWNDPTLAAWPQDSYDLFVGDLANDANDRLLEKCFKHYPSFLKARVVHKRGTANKFYGFVAFSDPFEMARALREMNGKYCGSRPMTIKRSTSDQREFSREVYQSVNKVRK